MQRRSVLTKALGGFVVLLGATTAMVLSHSGTSKQVKRSVKSSTSLPPEGLSHASTSVKSARHHASTTVPSELGSPSSTVAPSLTTSPRSEDTTTSTTALPALRWPQIARIEEIALGSVLRFHFGPSSSFSGDVGYLYRSGPSTFTALDSFCPHQGCQVQPLGGLMECPCHGSQFAVDSGAVIQGPATTGLGRATVSLSNGVISYVADV